MWLPFGVFFFYLLKCFGSRAEASFVESDSYARRPRKGLKCRAENVGDGRREDTREEEGVCESSNIDVKYADSSTGKGARRTW